MVHNRPNKGHVISYCVSVLPFKTCLFQDTPPIYDVSSITVPIAMFHGTSDWLVEPQGIKKLESQTRNLVFKREIPHWEHLDFIWAMDAPELCYEEIINLFKRQL